MGRTISLAEAVVVVHMSECLDVLVVNDDDASLFVVIILCSIHIFSRVTICNCYYCNISLVSMIIIFSGLALRSEISSQSYRFWASDRQARNTSKVDAACACDCSIFRIDDCAEILTSSWMRFTNKMNLKTEYRTLCCEQSFSSILNPHTYANESMCANARAPSSLVQSILVELILCWLGAHLIIS